MRTIDSIPIHNQIKHQHRTCRNLLLCLLAMILMISALPIQVWADNSSYNGTGGGSGGGSYNAAYSWNTTKQGYRVSIVDKDGSIVSTPIDFVYSQVPSNTEFYYDCKLESFASRTSPNPMYLISNVMSSEGFDSNKPLPSAMIWDYISQLGKSGPIAQGTLVKKWMMKGEFITGTYPQYNPSYWYPTTSGGNTGANESTGDNKGTENNEGTGESQDTTPSDTTTTPSTPSTSTQPDNKENDTQSSFLTEEQRNTYSQTYITLVRQEVEAFKRYGYTEDEIENGTRNFIMIELLPRINTLQISEYDKMVIQSNILNEYKNIISPEDIINKDNLSIAKSMFSSFLKIINPFEIAYASSTSGASNTSNSSQEDDGYIKSLLDYKVNGQYIFDIGDPSKGRVEIIQENDYRVMIEPILWFMPLTKSYEAYGKFIYGTITNIAQWSNYMSSHGYFDDGGIWHYWNIVRSVGAWSLYIEKDEEFTGTIIKSPAANFNTTPSVATLANNNIGYALHVYKTAGESVTQTYDPPMGDTEHPAPDPKSIPLKSGEKREINIVKTYQIRTTAGEIKHVTTLSRTKNPATIKILDEPTYKVKEWFISEVYNNPSSDTTWETSKQQAPSTGGAGSSPTKVKVEKPNTTLYVLLVKPEEVKQQDRMETDLIIHESQITKAVETINPNIENWGPKVMTFSAVDLNGICGERIIVGFNPQNNFPIFGTCTVEYQLDDVDWDYNAKNTKPIDTKIQANIGAFKPIMDKGADASGIRNTLNETKDAVESFNYKFTIWRGLDIPTIASYKNKNTSSIKDINNLLMRYGNTPQGNRYQGNVYTSNIYITLDMDVSLGDYRTTSKVPCNHRIPKTADHININTLNYDATATVEVYWGEQHEIGNDTASHELDLKTTLQGTNIKPKYHLGRMIQKDQAVTFYPYFRMTYQTTGQQDTERTNINILSQWLSEIMPNAYVEAAWASKEDFNLNLKSTQWSLHSKATSADKGWNHSNRVLPGGAIYTLDTEGKNKTYVSVVTWQPYFESEIINDVLLSGQSYTYEATEAPHKNLAIQAEETLENWRVVQYVKDVSKSNGKTPDITEKKNNTIALDGLKIEPNTSLRELGLTGKANDDVKYQLAINTTDNKVNESDIDILEQKEYITKYKVSADVEGKIHVYKDDSNSGWKEIFMLDKNQGAEALSGEALKLDQRTKIVTNLCKVLTRNTGNDTTASWASSDGKWYNEAFDGICIVRRETCFEVGYESPLIRSAALDPALCPVNKGQSDLFSKAYVSQFAMNNISDKAYGSNDGCIGTFLNQEVILPGWQEMFMSMPFAIPNATVQDLN